MSVTVSVATSGGRAEELDNRYQGACYYHNMKLTVRVCRSQHRGQLFVVVWSSYTFCPSVCPSVRPSVCPSVRYGVVRESHFANYKNFKKVAIFTNFNRRNEFYFLHFWVMAHQSTAFLQGANWNFSDLLIIIQELIHVGYQQSK